MVVSPELADVLSDHHHPPPRHRTARVPLVRVLRHPRTSLEPADAAAVPTRHRQRAPPLHTQRDPQTAHRRARRHRPHRRRRRTADASPPTTSEGSSSPTPSCTACHRTSPKSSAGTATINTTMGYKAVYPDGSDQRPPRVHRPPPRDPPQRGIPHPHRRRMGRVPRPLREAQGVGRRRAAAPSERRASTSTLCPMLASTAGPGATTTPGRDPEQPRGPHRPKPNFTAGSAKSRDSKSASPALKTNLPRSTQTIASPSTSEPPPYQQMRGHDERITKCPCISSEKPA